MIGRALREAVPAPCILLVVALSVAALSATAGEGPAGGRLEAPRVAPLDKEEWTEEQRAILEPLEEQGRLLNIYRTLARHPTLLEAWRTFGGYILSRSTLPPRHREMAMLRIGWLCRSDYEFGQHTRIALRVGLDEEDVRRITAGPDAPGWSAFERTLLRAVDELHEDAFVSDATWQSLEAEYDLEQILDLVFTVGQYNLVSMALNTLGVEREPGVTGFPEAAEP